MAEELEWPVLHSHRERKSGQQLQVSPRGCCNIAITLRTPVTGIFSVMACGC